MGKQRGRTPTPEVYRVELVVPVVVYDILVAQAQAEGKVVEIYLAEILAQAAEHGTPADLADALALVREQVEANVAVEGVCWTSPLPT